MLIESLNSPSLSLRLLLCADNSDPATFPTTMRLQMCERGKKAYFSPADVGADQRRWREGGRFGVGGGCRAGYMALHAIAKTGRPDKEGRSR